MKPKTQSEKIEVYLSKKKTLKRIKKGEISWKETAVGGCMSALPCTKRIMAPLSTCFGCGYAVIKKSKLENAIKQQKYFLSTLDKDSPEWRYEYVELEQLIKMKDGFEQ